MESAVSRWRSFHYRASDAGISLLLGVLILARWPASSVWAIGTLVGAAVLMSGISKIMIATKIRKGAVKLQRLARAA
jgi:hypothetical protein